MWLVMRNAHYLPTNNLKDLNCGNVRRFVMLSLIFGSIYFKIWLKIA